MSDSNQDSIGRERPEAEQNRIAELRATHETALREQDWYLAAATAEATGLLEDLDAALDAIRHTGVEAEIPRLRLGLARVRHTAQTDPDAALEAAQALDRQAAALGQRLEDPAVRVPTLELLVEVAALAGLDAAVVQLADALRAQALTAGLLERAVGAETLRAEALLRLDRPEDALEAARLAHGHGLRLPDKAWAARAAEARGVAARRTGHALEAAESFDAVLELGPTPEARSRVEALRAAAHLALGASPLEQLRLLERLAQDADPEARTVALSAIASATGASLGGAELDEAREALATGNHDAALRLLGSRTDAAALLVRAEALARVGDPVGAVAAADQSVAASRGLLDRARALVARSRHLFSLGDVDGARTDAREALHLARGLEHPELMGLAATELSRGLLASENIAAALDNLAEVALACARMGAMRAGLDLTVRRALTILEWPEAEVADAALEELLAQATSLSSPPLDLARAGLAWAAHTLSAGLFEEARAHLSRVAALADVHDLALGEDVSRLEAELVRRLGGNP